MQRATTSSHTMTHLPGIVRFSTPITRRLLRMGMPMGPNVLLTVRGRKSGLPRTVPVAVIEHDGRRWLVGTFADAQWVKNLRAAREGTIKGRGGSVAVEARELNPDDAAAFYGETLVAFRRSLPLRWRLATWFLLRLSAPEMLEDPARAALTRPVFELRLQPA